MISNRLRKRSLRSHKTTELGSYCYDRQGADGGAILFRVVFTMPRLAAPVLSGAAHSLLDVGPPEGCFRAQAKQNRHEVSDLQGLLRGVQGFSGVGCACNPAL